MRITRLHLLLACVGVMLLAFGGARWWLNLNLHIPWKSLKSLRSAKSSAPPPMPVRSVPQPPPPPPPALEADMARVTQEQRAYVAQSIAIVGEAYQSLAKQYGDVPPVSKPLRSAKDLHARGEDEQALALTREAWQGIKTFRSKVGEVTQSYQVVQGDTLWRIARVHSPVKAGAGWVTIWKANKNLVNNFDRLEVGWTLSIPMKPSQYVMPFWKPK